MDCPDSEKSDQNWPTQDQLWIQQYVAQVSDVIVSSDDNISIIRSHKLWGESSAFTKLRDILFEDTKNISSCSTNLTTSVIIYK
jgi:hypothetical protein